MNLSEIRTQIDAVDQQLLELFLQRMALAEEVGRYKIANRLPVLNAAREEDILARVAARAGDQAPYACQLFSTLFELSRARQAELLKEADSAREGSGADA